MENYTGFLLKQYRYAHNLSQESLCKGICAISYLSKIENGQADPSKEIITLLFQKLEIDFNQDETFINSYDNLLFRFFDSYFHNEDLQELSYSILKVGGNLKHSPLNIKFLLFEIYNIGNQISTNDIEKIQVEKTNPVERESADLTSNIEKKNLLSKEIANRLETLSNFIDYMDKKEKFLFYIGHGFTENWQNQLEAFHQADILLPCSISSYLIAEILCNNGKPDISLDYCQQGYHRAVDEGNIIIMKDISLTKLKCYGNLGNLELLKKEYKKCCELGRTDKELMASFHYNTGACILEWGGYEESLSYLLKALALNETNCLLHQKLALAYGKLQNNERANDHVTKAYNYLPKHHSFYNKMIRFSELRLAKNFHENEEYIDILTFLYENLEDELYASFKKFYTPYMIELLESQRRYKEISRIMRENYVCRY